jgi:hypothetical protein
MDSDFLKASNGDGEAVRAIVTSIRTAGATIIDVDAITNWPDSFIATSGTLGSDGTLDPSSVLVFYGHKNVSQIVIDDIAPGYTDNGNTVGQVLVLKPTTLWADEHVRISQVSHNPDGTLKDDAVDSSDVLANGVVTNAKLSLAAGEPGADNSYTPTLANITLGTGGTAVGKYTKIGKQVNFEIIITLGTGGSFSANPTFTLPVTAASGYDFNNSMIGVASSRDASSAELFAQYTRILSTTTASVASFNVSTSPGKLAGITGSSPMGWAVGDILCAQGSYRAA